VAPGSFGVNERLIRVRGLSNPFASCNAVVTRAFGWRSRPRTLAIMAPASIPRLVSVQVGLPAVHGDGWRTGFYKSAVAGPVRLGRTNLDGDGQANRKVHGGPDKAVLAYAAGHYPAWRRELAIEDLAHGAFGENFTLTLLDESNVCLG